MSTAGPNIHRFLAIYRAFRRLGHTRRESLGAAWGNVSAARRQSTEGNPTRAQSNGANGESP